MSIGSAPSGSTSTLKPLRKPAASNAWFHQLAPSTQRLLHVFRRAGIHPVLNRLDRLADRRARILLLQAMAADVAHLHRLADRHAVVDEGQAAVAGARIVVARLVVVVRQLDERDVLAHRHRFGRRRHAGDRARRTGRRRVRHRRLRRRPPPLSDSAGALRRSAATAAASAGRVVREGQRHLDLGVLRERLRARQVERAARAVDAVGARTQRAAGAGDVAQQEVGRVHEHVAAALGGDGEAPQHRLGERILDRLALERVARCSIGTTGSAAPAARAGRRAGTSTSRAPPPLPRSSPMSFDPRPAASPVVSRNSVSKRGISRNMRSGALVPVEREVAVELLHAGGALARSTGSDRRPPARRRDRRHRRRPGAGACCACKGRRHQQRERQRQPMKVVHRLNMKVSSRANSTQWYDRGHDRFGQAALSGREVRAADVAARPRGPRRHT